MCDYGKKIQVKYLWYSLTVSLEELFIKSKGSTFEAVTVTDVQNLLIILPPKNEQDAIVNFLDQRTAEIDSLVTETKTKSKTQRIPPIPYIRSSNR